MGGENCQLHALPMKSVTTYIYEIVRRSKKYAVCISVYVSYVRTFCATRHIKINITPVTTLWSGEASASGLMPHTDSKKKMTPTMP